MVFGSFILFALLSKKVSLGSICGALACGIGSVIFAPSTPRMVLGIFAMLVVVIRHWENIGRLIKGTEPDFKPAKSRAKAEKQ